MEAPVRPERDGALLHFLYRRAAGRCILKVLSSRIVSKAAGVFLDSRCSHFLIKPFIAAHNVSLEECVSEDFMSFNDFFGRKLRKDKRPVDRAPESLIAPCDGLLSAYEIERNMVIPVKQSSYSLKSLLAGDEIYREYRDGICLVFRLRVDHYHRYCYVDSGVKKGNRKIEGQLHTVRPVALTSRPVFAENCREYTVIDTDHFGRIVQMEVGAMLVGKIKNYHGAGRIYRGQEKGRFLYGGSTIIVLLKKGAAKLPQSLLRATAAGMEVPVKMGEKIGKTAKIKS